MLPLPMLQPTFNQREFFRLNYLDERSATIVINRREYFVPEISERGLRIQGARFREFRINEEICGRLKLINGDIVTVTGVIVRRDAKHYILGELAGLTLRRFMSEQRVAIDYAKIKRGLDVSQAMSKN
jgi:hypothetical protein